MRFSDRRKKSPRFGFVINADCDLANKKNDGVISYLPIYTLDNYLERYWLPSFIRSETKNRVNAICEDLGVPHQERGDFQDWMSDAGPNQVLSVMMADRGMRAKVECRIRDNCKFLEKLMNNETIEVLAELAKLQGDSDKYLKRNLTTGLRALDDSSIYINEIYGENELGYVIRVNRILSIAEAKCHRYRPEFLKNNIDLERAERTAAFSDLFRFKVIQTFGSQFTRVGTDDFFKHASQIAIDELSEKLLREPA